MTAQPIPLPEPTRKDPHPQRLPRLSADYAAAHDLVTPRQIADYYGSTVPNLNLFMRRPGAPKPLGETELPNRTRREKLFAMAAIETFMQRQGGTFGSRRRSRPPRRIGTTTPSAGRGYQWRDPARRFGASRP